MKKMKVSEYRPLFIEAIRKSKEERWIPRTIDKNVRVPDCSLCGLASMFDDNRKYFKV